MRKDADFEVMDHINVYVKGNDKIAAIMERNKDAIQGKVLADSIVAGEVKGNEKEWNINGEDVVLAVEKR